MHGTIAGVDVIDAALRFDITAPCCTPCEMHAEGDQDVRKAHGGHVHRNRFRSAHESTPPGVTLNAARSATSRSRSAARSSTATSTNRCACSNESRKMTTLPPSLSFTSNETYLSVTSA